MYKINLFQQSYSKKADTLFWSESHKERKEMTQKIKPLKHQKDRVVEISLVDRVFALWSLLFCLSLVLILRKVTPSITEIFHLDKKRILMSVLEKSMLFSISGVVLSLFVGFLKINIRTLFLRSREETKNDRIMERAVHRFTCFLGPMGISLGIYGLIEPVEKQWNWSYFFLQIPTMLILFVFGLFFTYAMCVMCWEERFSKKSHTQYGEDQTQEESSLEHALDHEEFPLHPQ